MGKIVAFLAECQGSPTIDNQKAAMAADAQILIAGRQSLNKLGDVLARGGIKLEAGDSVVVYDLSCITLSTSTLVRIISRLLRNGISFEIVSAGIIITPDGDDKLYGLIRALDGHFRHLHRLKTRPEAASRGRKPLLDPNDLKAIKAKLSRPGATATQVAQGLGVSRSTLFNFLERYDFTRGGGGKEIDKRSLDDSSERDHFV